MLKKGKWNNIIFNINVQQLSSHLDPVNGDCEAYEAPCPFHTIGCQDEEVGPVNTCYFTFEKPFFFPSAVLLNPFITVKCKYILTSVSQGEN